MDTTQENVVPLEKEVQDGESKPLWVFGYGSLCWKPGFEFHRAVIGCVKGYQRRFWQGNTTHRGTEEKPGRVATLIEDGQGVVHGVAYLISGAAALPYLTNRECTLGAYITIFTEFFPIQGKSFNALAYIATPSNPLWLGHADKNVIAQNIVDCSGPSGHNVEYLVRLANFMREHFSQDDDPHLFSIEAEVLDLIKNKNICLESLMGNGEDCINFVTKTLPSTAFDPDHQDGTDDLEVFSKK